MSNRANASEELEECVTRDANGMNWRVDPSDKQPCIDCDGEGVQVSELAADRYVCPDCGQLWNPNQVEEGNNVA